MKDKKMENKNPILSFIRGIARFPVGVFLFCTAAAATIIGTGIEVIKRSVISLPQVLYIAKNTLTHFGIWLPMQALKIAKWTVNLPKWVKPKIGQLDNNPPVTTQKDAIVSKSLLQNVITTFETALDANNKALTTSASEVKKIWNPSPALAPKQDNAKEKESQKNPSQLNKVREILQLQDVKNIKDLFALSAQLMIGSSPVERQKYNQARNKGR